jgi:hypothetical protein
MKRDPLEVDTAGSPTLSERRVWSRRNESFPAKSFSGFTRRSMSIFLDQGRSIPVVVSLSFRRVVRYQYTYYKSRLCKRRNNSKKQLGNVPNSGSARARIIIIDLDITSIMVRETK